TSLIIALVVAGAIAYGATLWLQPRVAQGAAIWGAVVGVLAVYAAALLNKAMRRGFMSYLAQQVIIVLIPPLALIFLVLGTIFLGIATPTEGGAMGAVGALALAFAKRRFSLDLLIQAMQSTTTLSAFVLFILIGSRVFSLTFYGVNGHLWVEHLLASVPGGETGFLIVVNAIVFFLAFFLDFFELAFIIVPLLAPVADKMGIDLIWFGVLLAINMQTSFMHPPFGFALFYLRSVAPQEDYVDKVTGKRIAGMRTSQIYWGAVPFVCIQIVMVALTIIFPGMVLRYRGETPPPSVEQITIPQPNGGLSLPPLGGGAPGTDQNRNNPLGLPPITGPGTAPDAGGKGSGGTAPALGLPPLELGGEKKDATRPAQPPKPDSAVPDLSQPPSFQ
ncbi:MAG: TRAP transporter large permease subunit, partial [Pararhizobium sp.]